MNSHKSRSISSISKELSEKNECICERPQMHLICIDCHRTIFGRVQKICEQHPSVSDSTFFYSSLRISTTSAKDFFF